LVYNKWIELMQSKNKLTQTNAKIKRFWHNLENIVVARKLDFTLLNKATKEVINQYNHILLYMKPKPEWSRSTLLWLCFENGMKHNISLFIAFQTKTVASVERASFNQRWLKSEKTTSINGAVYQKLKYVQFLSAHFTDEGHLSAQMSTLKEGT
jgi:6-pyruvoyl-tetrahydropterin synthase